MIYWTDTFTVQGFCGDIAIDESVCISENFYSIQNAQFSTVKILDNCLVYGSWPFSPPCKVTYAIKDYKTTHLELEYYAKTTGLRGQELQIHMGKPGFNDIYIQATQQNGITAFSKEMKLTVFCQKDFDFLKNSGSYFQLVVSSKRSSQIIGKVDSLFLLSGNPDCVTLEVTDEKYLPSRDNIVSIDSSTLEVDVKVDKKVEFRTMHVRAWDLVLRKEAFA